MSLESCNHQSFVVVFDSLINPTCPVCNIAPPPSGQSYIDRGDVQDFDFDVNDFISDSSWRELDLSAIVPEGVTLLDITIAVRANPGSSCQLVVRNYDHDNGINSIHTDSTITNACQWASGNVTCNANRKVKYYLVGSDISTVHFLVRGWWI